jgi:hypothetical protein
MKTLISGHYSGVDGIQARGYILRIISPVASVAGREAGSLESASAFSGRAA